MKIRFLFSDSAFTLVEILVALALAAVIILSTYTAFSSIMASYKKARIEIDSAANAKIALQKIKDDLLYAYVTTDKPFIGYSPLSTTFFTPSLDTVCVWLDNRGYSQDSLLFYIQKNADTLNYITYGIDSQQEILYRSIDGVKEPLAFGVQYLNFLFWGNDTVTNTWSTHWNSEETLPKSIYIVIGLREQQSKTKLHTAIYTTLVTLF